MIVGGFTLISYLASLQPVDCNQKSNLEVIIDLVYNGIERAKSHNPAVQAVLDKFTNDLSNQHARILKEMDFKINDRFWIVAGNVFLNLPIPENYKDNKFDDKVSFKMFEAQLNPLIEYISEESRVNIKAGILELRKRQFIRMRNAQNNAPAHHQNGPAYNPKDELAVVPHHPFMRNLAPNHQNFDKK